MCTICLELFNSIKSEKVSSELTWTEIHVLLNFVVCPFLLLLIFIRSENIPQLICSGLVAFIQTLVVVLQICFFFKLSWTSTKRADLCFQGSCVCVRLVCAQSPWKISASWVSHYKDLAGHQINVRPSAGCRWRAWRTCGGRSGICTCTCESAGSVTWSCSSCYCITCRFGWTRTCCRARGRSATARKPAPSWCPRVAHRK